LVREFEKITGSSIDVEYLPATENDPQQRKPNIELARNKIGFSPKVGLNEGLKKTIIYFYNS
jgi:UDP-glucuronate decarboxylase